MRLPPFQLAVFLLICAPIAAAAQVRITEFMASNTHTLYDEDGETSDWIEIQNTSATTVSLLNWALSDTAGNPSKWLFPATNLASGTFMVVFASGKDRRVPGSPLHTNFKLNTEGEFLSLTAPDGTTATQLTPQYPQQFPDVSYGIEMLISSTTLIASNATLVYCVPTNSADDATWTLPGFAATDWRTGTNGIGYETGLYDPQEESFYLKMLDTQPVAYWRLNETNGPAAVNSGTEGVADQAGYIGTFALTNAGPRPQQFGFFETNNNAPYFNGTGSYVNGPYQLLDDLPAFTIAGWIKPMATPQSRTGLFGQNDTIEFGFINATTLNVWTYYGSTSYTWPYPANQWHYVAAVGGKGTLALFVDGRRVASSAANPATYGNSEFDFNIGGGGIWDASGNYFAGQIDEVAVWYRALAANELAALVATNAEQVDFTTNIATDVKSLMYGSNATAYVRIPFNVTDPASFAGLKLQVRFDDGFVAYLNGHLVASSNAPAALAWNSAATQRHLDLDAVKWTQFDLGSALPYLQTGANVLAIQGLNISATNTDFLLQAQLVAQTILDSGTTRRYFTQATPGGPNGLSPADWGPIISDAGHTPTVLFSTNSLMVTSQVARAFSSITNVALHYRVMFNAEAVTPMNDAGTNKDATAGDGVWTGIIPAGVAAPGQLLRYYVTATDAAGNTSRWPIFPDTLVSEQYLGTVVADPSIRTLLPVMYLFVQNVAAGDTTTGTQGSIFYLGELYDNLSISLHGQNSAGWPKKSYNIALPKDHQLLYQPGASREKNFRLLSNYGDKMRMHTTLTYEAVAMGGAYGHFSFPVRIQRNGAFFGIEDMVEDGDDYFLSRLGLDPNGALYKMYNDLSSASGNEKKTRKWEGTDDLTAFINNLNEGIPSATRVTYAWDSLDLPQVAGYFATMALTSNQDLGHKNYYLFHDNDGAGEWAILPWDVDLSWGRNWVDSIGYFSDILYQTNVLNFYDPVQQGKASNRLFNLFFNTPAFRQMYLRRLRTLMGTILMPPGTPTNQLVLEPIIRHAEDLMQPTNITPSDAILDFAAWGPTWGSTNLSVVRTEAERTISVHLAGRRSFLYTSANATLNGDHIPGAQPANAVVYFAAWDYLPLSGNLTEQYVQLRNTNSYAVDVSSWQVSGAISFKFRGGTVIPAGGSLYLAPSVKAFRARTNGPSARQNLYVQGPWSGHLSRLGNSPLILQNSSGSLVSSNSYAAYSARRFLPGNLVVLRVGDGVESPSGHGNSVFLDQFSTNGTFLNSVPVPANATNALILSGSAASEGGLTRSADGRLLLLAGYNIALTNSLSSLASSAATDVPRVLGALDIAGGFSLVGVTTNQYSNNNIRSGTSDGWGNYWGAGANSGTFYFGDAAPDAVQTYVANTRAIQDLGGSLYFSTSTGTPGIWRISGTPTVSSGPPSLVFALGATGSPYAFAFNPDFTVAYVADDTLAGEGGVQRWDFADGNWALSYVFTGLTNTGARGLTVDFSGPRPVLYATTAESKANRLVALVDAGPTSPITTLATAGANQLFRGVAFTPDADIAPHIFNATHATEGFRLSWTALIGRSYTLESAGTLSNPNWLTVTKLVTTGPVANATDTAPSADTRFYRIMLNP
jgi:hypothetical protein